MSLSVRGLAFGFADRPVGELADATLREGEVTCLLGPNGSGKTTLLRTLLGLQPPLAGVVMLGEAPLASVAPRERARRLAYVPQAAESHFDFSIAEIVGMGRAMHAGVFSAPSAADRAATQAAMERLGVAHLSARLVRRVSGGEGQLALIARALATEASVLVMDEPTANLDFANQARVLREIRRLRDAGIAVLFSTHHPDHALRIADAAWLLKSGRLLAAGPVEATVNSRNLSALYDCPVEVVAVASGDGRATRVCIARDEGLFG